MRWLPARLKESQIQQMNLGQIVEEIQIDEKYKGGWYISLAWILAGQIYTFAQQRDFQVVISVLVIFAIGAWVITWLTKQTIILKKRLFELTSGQS